MGDFSALCAVPGFAAISIACAVVFALREVVAFKGALGLKYLLTPLITFLILVIVFLSAGKGMSSYALLVACAIGLSLIGDVMLMIEENNYFIHGLVFFLSAHIAYVFAFSIGYSWRPWNLAVILVLAAVYLGYNLKLRKPAVAVYSALLMLMLFFAFTSFNGGGSTRPAILSAGAVLFALSDGLLGVNAFVHPIPKSTVFTWALYAPAQFLFAVSCHL